MTSVEQRLEEYRAFRSARATLLAEASAPSLVRETVTGRAARSAGEPSQENTPPVAPFELLDLVSERARRSSGARFGTLVHALLAQLSLATDAHEVAPLAALLGRTLGASDDEVRDAEQAVSHALSQPFFLRVRAALARGEAYREAPLLVREGERVVLEGAVDLAFREQGRLVLVDFKTDVELTKVDLYGRQLGLYAAALERALSVPVIALLVRV